MRDILPAFPVGFDHQFVCPALPHNPRVPGFTGVAVREASQVQARHQGREIRAGDRLPDTAHAALDHSSGLADAYARSARSHLIVGRCYRQIGLAPERIAGPRRSSRQFSRAVSTQRLRPSRFGRVTRPAAGEVVADLRVQAVWASV